MGIENIKEEIAQDKRAEEIYMELIKIGGFVFDGEYFVRPVFLKAAFHAGVAYEKERASKE